MLTENEHIEERSELNERSVVEDKSQIISQDKSINNLDNYQNQSSDAVLNIKTTLLKPEEVKRYGNRLIEDSNYKNDYKYFSQI